MSVSEELQAYRDVCAALVDVAAPVGRPSVADVELRDLLRTHFELGGAALDLLSEDSNEAQA